MAANVDDLVVSQCQPAEADMKVWRYMDPVRLLAFLQTESLSFARLDTFKDPFEGSLPRRNYVARKQQIRHILVREGADRPEEEWEAAMQDVTRRARECAYVSCWHGGETESLAMWKLYGAPTGSVAIQTTYRKLVEALPQQLCHPSRLFDGERWTTDVYMGMVQYLDYGHSDDYIPGGNLLYPFMHKRKELDHEKEVRALAFFTEALKLDLADGTRFLDRISMPRGLSAKVDIGQLVETIRVQPATPQWARRAIENLVRQHGWDMKLIRSEIDAAPLY